MLKNFMALQLIRFIPPFTNSGHFGICQVVIKRFSFPPYISRFSYYKKQPSVAKNFKVRIYGSKTTNTDEAGHLPIAFILPNSLSFLQKIHPKKCKKHTVFSGELNHLFCKVISLTNAFQCKYLSTKKSRI